MTDIRIITLNGQMLHARQVPEHPTEQDCYVIAEWCGGLYFDGDTITWGGKINGRMAAHAAHPTDWVVMNFHTSPITRFMLSDAAFQALIDL